MPPLHPKCPVRVEGESLSKEMELRGEVSEIKKKWGTIKMAQSGEMFASHSRYRLKPNMATENCNPCTGTWGEEEKGRP